MPRYIMSNDLKRRSTAPLRVLRTHQQTLSKHILRPVQGETSLRQLFKNFLKLQATTQSMDVSQSDPERSEIAAQGQPQ